MHIFEKNWWAPDKFLKVMAVSESSRLSASLKKENVPVNRLIVNQILPPSASECKFCAMKRKVLCNFQTILAVVKFYLLKLCYNHTHLYNLLDCYCQSGNSIFLLAFLYFRTKYVHLIWLRVTQSCRYWN